MKKKIGFAVVAMFTLGAALLFALTSGLGTAVTVHASSRNSEVLFGPVQTRGGTLIQSFTRQTPWHTRESQQHIVSVSGSNPIGMPTFPSNFTCGIVSALQIVAGYNKVHTSLIPGFNSIAYVWNQPRWAGVPTPALQAVEVEIFNRMGGNPQGVTHAQYINGLNSLAQNRGRTFTNVNMMSGNQLNFPAIQAQLRQNRYATVFMAGSFNVAGITVQNGFDFFSLEEYAGNHIMAVFGYRVITYRNASGQITRVKRFLEVATGFSGNRALLYLDNYLTISGANITHIS